MLSETAEAAAAELIGATARRHSPLARVVPSESLSIGLTLAGIVLASTGAQILLGLPIRAPWIFPDELVYSDLARGFAESAHFTVRGEPFSALSFGPLYPILIAPAFRLFDPATAYAVVKALNALMFSLAAVPAFFLARRLLTRRYALGAATLAVAVPSAVYTSKFMTESLAYPLFLAASLAIVRALERRSWQRELVALAAILAAAGARGQLIVLLPALLLTIGAVTFLDQFDNLGRPDVRGWLREMARYRLTLFTAAASIAAAALGWRAGVAGGVAGGHGEAFAAVSLGTIALSFAYHIAALDLYVGIIPFATLALVCLLALRPRSCAREVRVLCALTVSTTILLAAAAARYLVAVYARDPSSYARVYDRYEFYVVPLFGIVFLWWVERGLPRLRGRTMVAIAAPAALLPLTLPLAHLLNGREWGTSSSTVVLVPWAILRVATGSLLGVYAGVAIVCLGLAYSFVRSRNGGRLVLLVAMSMLVVTLFVTAGNAMVSRRAGRIGIGTKTPRTWIDDRVGARGSVVAVWSGVKQRTWKGWYAIWEAELFNNSVKGVYDLREPMRYPLPSTPLRLHGKDLTLPGDAPFAAQYVLTDVKTPIRGRVVAADRANGLVLVRVDGLVRLR